MKRALIASSLVAGLCLIGLAVAGEVKSGLQPGAVPSAFQVRNITGQSCKGIVKDARGQLCYR